MRQRIDITEAEADTKIRGKYLRALENEEWALLPGPTFVKSFLRTYADYLGLDGRSLVEEFKLKFERSEMQAIAPPRPREQGRRQRGGRGGPPGGGRLWLAPLEDQTPDFAAWVELGGARWLAVPGAAFQNSPYLATLNGVPAIEASSEDIG